MSILYRGVDNFLDVGGWGGGGLEFKCIQRTMTTPTHVTTPVICDHANPYQLAWQVYLNSVAMSLESGFFLYLSIHL